MASHLDGTAHPSFRWHPCDASNLSFPRASPEALFYLQEGAKKPAEAGNDRKVLTSRVYQRARNKPAREALIRFASTPARMARMP